VREIERKFLIRKLPSTLQPYPRHVINQGYLVFGENGVEVRLRRSNEQHSLTVKSKHGLEREEHNIPLTEEQWSELWPLTAGRRLKKLRFDIPHGEYIIELDIFLGLNDGLVVAEVEFPTTIASHGFVPPSWFDQEVTGDPEFSNRRRAVE